MRFTSKDVAFGRHETFHLRFSWLAKGFARLTETPDLFTDIDKATLTLGVGKNMVLSIRYWLRAAQLLDDSSDTTTEIGNYLFNSDGADPFMEDEGTLWLIHWLIASNTNTATTISWFFNKYHKGLFDQNELRAAFSNYLKESVIQNRRPAASTLKNDISVLTRLYAKSHSSNVVEDALDSPLSELGLINELGKTSYSSAFEDHPDLPSEILGFAIIQLMNFRQTNILPIEELIQSAENFVAPGTIFRLTEAAFMAKLEALVRSYPQTFALRETAGLRQLYLGDDVLAVNMLNAHYMRRRSSLGEVA